MITYTVILLITVYLCVCLLAPVEFSFRKLLRRYRSVSCPASLALRQACSGTSHRLTLDIRLYSYAIFNVLFSA